MKKFVVGFYTITSCLFTGFIFGGTIAKFFFTSGGDGLAGAATAAMLGFLGAGIGLVLSIVMLRNLTEKIKVITAIVLTIISAILMIVFHYQFKQRQLKNQQENVGLFVNNDSNGSVIFPTALVIKQEASI